MEINLKKIFSWLISAVLTWLLKKILDSTGIYETLTAYFQKPETKEKAVGFLSTSIPIWKVVIYFVLLIVSILLAWVIFRLFFGKAARLEKMKKEIIRDNVRNIPQEGLKIRYTVEFDDDDTILVGGVVPYCTKHGNFPIKMAQGSNGNYSCSAAGCLNGINSPSYQSDAYLGKVKNIILSELQDNWLKMNKS